MEIFIYSFRHYKAVVNSGLSFLILIVSRVPEKIGVVFTKKLNLVSRIGLLMTLIGFSSFAPIGSNAPKTEPLKHKANVLLPVAPDCNTDWNVVANKSTITITSELTTGAGSLPLLLDGTAGNQNGYWNTVATVANKEIFKFHFSQATVLNGIEMTRSFNISNGVTYRIEGSNNGTSWTDLTGTQTFSSTATAAAYGAPDDTRKLPITGNTTAYAYYRVYGLSGNSAGNWISELYFGTVTRSAGLTATGYSYGANTAITSDDRITFSLNPTIGTGTYNVSVSSGSISPTSATYGSATAFALQPGSAGAGNVTVTITDVANNCEITQVITDPGIEPYDTDNDGVNNLVDLDDDNDGILDSVEGSYCNLVNYNTNLTEKAKITLSSTAATSGSIAVLLDGNVANNSFYYTGTSQAVAGKVYVQMDFVKPTLLKGFELAVGAWLFANGAVMKVQGSNDGTTWTDLLTSTRTQAEPACAYGTCTTSETFAFSTNTTAYTSYRLLGVSGTSRQVPWVNELFFDVAAIAVCDFDNDGIPNRLDLDSDNDGIPDNVEAQPTLTYVGPNADSPATYAANNGVNSAYPGGLTPVDTDSDACQDFIDTDSDDDGDLDKTESGLTFTGVPGLNGLDSGSEAADTYADVNGIVDVPKTKLSGTNPGVGEVNYREVAPLKRTITVCYKSGIQYGIGGSERTFAADKLLKAANFSKTGTSTFTFKPVAFSTAFTKSGLEAQGCQILDLGITNGDAGSVANNDTYTNTEEDEIIAWSAASRSNVVLAYQGYAVRLGGSGYVGASGNTNPNSLTTLGQAIINGPFGTVPSFNQGGSFQGAYTQIPASACRIVEDNNATKRATGVVDKLTGDVYLSDVDLVTELGGLTSNDGITSSTDIFFANLYHSLAKLVVFAPTDPCTYFTCAAGQHAPVLSSAGISGTGSVNLSSITASNTPANTTLTWHTAVPATTANKIANPSTYSTSGTVFASFYDSVSDCYAGVGTATKAVTVTIISASPQADLSVSIATPSQTGNKGEQLTYVVTLSNAGPATATNVVVDVPMPEPKATLLVATPATGTYNSVTKEWTVPSLAVGSTTLTFTVKVN